MIRNKGDENLIGVNSCFALLTSLSNKMLTVVATSRKTQPK